jgi:hypothetical protein
LAGPNDLPGDAFVAGWEDVNGRWMNTEDGDPQPSERDLQDSYWTVVSWTNDIGETVYKSIMGGVEDWDGLADAIQDLMDEY